MTTPKISLNKPDYRDPRWDIPVNQNWDVLDSLHGVVTSELKTLLTSATITDVFIYDTTKDSDGGAWRQRCQMTSWYNEPLNTAIRGATREFPAVVLIVAQAGGSGNNYIRIYDATVVGCPLWMVFQGLGSAPLRTIVGSASATITSIWMLNGKLLIGTSNFNLQIANFITDKAFVHSVGGLAPLPQDIQSRNTTASAGSSAAPGLISGIINDVAMTVLDAAPIDPDTLLPVPTIAVATAGGVSVIDGPAGVGTVRNIIRADGQSASSISPTVAFLGNRLLLQCSSIKDAVTLDIPSVNSSYSIVSNAKIYNELSAPYPFKNASYYSTPQYALAKIVDGFALSKSDSSGQDLGLTLIKEAAVKVDGMAAWLSSKYNSGWMRGDIRRAFLGDALGTAETLTNLVTNGTFDTDTGWEKGAGWTISGGIATCVAPGVTANLTQEIPGIANKLFSITYTITRSAGSFRIVAGNSDIGPYRTVSGTYTDILMSTSTDKINLQGTLTFSGTVDNVTVTPAILDRSVKASAANVIGTLTREPVATGAELQCIKFPTANSRVVQEYSSDLAFGTGEFFMMCWAYFPSAEISAAFIGVSLPDASVIGPALYLTGTTLRFRGISNTGAAEIPLANVPKDQWIFMAGVRRGTTLHLYLNGIGVASGTHANNLDYAGAVLSIGAFYDGSSDLDDGKMSLIRIGAGAPSDAQIAEIYRTELPMFQPGAKCTLQGTSDVVKALSYDDKSDLLYVGTADGVTAFKDLRVVDLIPPLSGNLVSISANDDDVLIGTTSAAIASIKEVNIREEIKSLENKPPLRVFGDSVNYSEFEYNGHLTFNGSATVWDDIRFSASQMRANPTTLKPDFDETEIGYLFDAGTTETLLLIAQMPHSYKNGSEIHPHVHWMPTSTNTGSVLWRMEYKWVNMDDVTPASFTTIDILGVGSGVIGKHQRAYFPPIVGTGKEISSILSIRLSRIGGDVTDTYTADALLKEFDIHFELDSVGSREEHSK